jgi:AcrR family transcriptional regulator
MRAYHSPKRELDAQRTRARIIGAATRQLRLARGSSSLSLEAVAEAAGVTRVTVYKQFGSRRGLLEAVFDHVAREGGLHRIPQAMAEKDPRVALERIVAIFCDFWYYNRKMMARILGAGAIEPRLELAIRERNERRRTVIAAILKRVAGAEQVPRETFNEVVDVLFVLTSHPVFAGLEGKGRSVATVCRLVQDLAIRTLDRLKR